MYAPTVTRQTAQMLYVAKGCPCRKQGMYMYMLMLYENYSLPCMQIDIWHKVYCDWIEGINVIGRNMFFQCQPDAFMAGIRSTTYNFIIEDRVYVSYIF